MMSVTKRLCLGAARAAGARGQATDTEAAAYVAEADALREWWGSERFKDTKREYSAAEVVALRGTLPPTNSAADEQAKKAWKLFHDLRDQKASTWTFGALDPVQCVQMAKWLPTVYVSGWQCSSTASTTNEPGPDVADYPMNTVPNKVDQLFRAQRFHDRKQRYLRSQMQPRQRLSTPPVDYLAPIIADGDAGHGGLSAVMKLTKLFVEAGAAGIHFEDQRSGSKRCGHMGGKVLVSTQEHVERLKAARLQCDIMNTETLIVARTDAEAANLLDTNWDERDQPFILGTANSGLRPMFDLFECLTGTESAAEIAAMQATWIRDAELCTYYVAVRRAIEQSSLAASRKLLAQWMAQAEGLSHRKAMLLANDLGFGGVDWSWDKPRTREGYFMLEPSVAHCVARAKAYAPHADLLWMETASPTVADAEVFANGVHAEFPNALLAYNLSPSFNWERAGLDAQELESFVRDIGELGYIWQFITLGGLHTNALSADLFARDFAKRGMASYVELVQSQERLKGVETLKHQMWSGASLVDAQLQAVQGSGASTLAMGAGVTEAQFTTSMDDPETAWAVREARQRDFNTATTSNK